MNLRGVKESGTIFAIPTYGFIAVTFGMIGTGFWRMLEWRGAGCRICIRRDRSQPLVVGVAGCAHRAESVRPGLHRVDRGRGGQAMGAPTSAPKSRNAANTLVAMGAVNIAMFAVSPRSPDRPRSSR